MLGLRVSPVRSRLILAAVLAVTYLIAAALLVAGCGEDFSPAADTTLGALSAETSRGTLSTDTTNEAADTSTTTIIPAVPDAVGALTEVFSTLAGQLNPTPVYTPTYLPAGTTLAGRWWPVAELEDPSRFEGDALPNPRVDEPEGAAASAQVVLAVGDGWLAVLQNFRGDLGDTEGTDVGTVQGHPAKLYTVAGASVVQWSDSGMWYAVVGRDLPVEEVAKVALGMERVVRESPEQ